MDFKFPDAYGVFTLQVLHERLGLSWILVKDTVQVRPYRHDQYPRFLKVAFPYYVNCFSLMFGFIMVCGVWLFFVKNEDGVKKDIKKD